MFGRTSKDEVLHVLRYDDFSAISDAKVEQALIDVLLHNSFPCTFAAIPFVCSPDELLARSEVKLLPLPKEKAHLLKDLLQAGLAEIALHGYAHLALAPYRHHQEFCDAVPAETQRTLIRRGRQYLEDLFGVRITIFVPPWNAIAGSTVKILREEELFLSAGHHAHEISNQIEIPLLSCDVEMHETAGALRLAQLFGGNNQVGTILHDYDFVESSHNVGTTKISELGVLLKVWSQSENTRRMLVSDAIRASEDTLREKIHANNRLRYYLGKRKTMRRILPKADSVFWEARVARQLAFFTRCLP